MPDEIMQRMLFDETYGLGYADDINKWNKWYEICDPDPYQKNEAKLEFLTYFNVTRDQVDDVELTFCDLVEKYEAVAQNLCAVSGCTQNEFAFWQWATS